MARRLSRGLVVAALVGATIGVSARALMRGVALSKDTPTDFTVAGTGGIALLFALSAVGAAVAGTLAPRWWRTLLIVVPTSFLMFAMGVAIGQAEIRDGLDLDLSAPRVGVLFTLSGLLAALAVATPWTGYRIGSARRGAEVTDRYEGAPVRSASDRSTQNSLPSGSAITTQPTPGP